jgi:hypothetical protein
VTRRADALLAPARDLLERARQERHCDIQEWAATHVMHPRGSGPRPHDPALTPYWTHWLDIAQARLTGRPLDHDPAAHLCEQMYVVAGTQCGKTMGFLYLLLAWVAACMPRATALILPRIDDIKKAQRARVRPLFEVSPGLTGLLGEGQMEIERRLGQRLWELASMVLYWLNGGAAADLRSIDVPLELFDEFDVLAHDLDGAGDPIDLGLDRQKTYPHDRLLAGITSPGLIAGHGWRRLTRGTHERLLIACPACGAHHYLSPAHLAIPGDATPDEARDHDLAAWSCPHCRVAHRTAAIRLAIAAACAQRGWSAAGGWAPGTWQIDDQQPAGGLWVPVDQPDASGHIVHIQPPTSRIRSGWINSLYSPYISLSEYWAHGREARLGTESQRQAHVNGWDAEPWRPSRDAVDAADLVDLVQGERYQHGTCPTEPRLLILTADQQGNSSEKSWFPFVLRGYAANGDSDLIEAGRVNSWAELESLTTRRWPCGTVNRAPDISAIDCANGNMTRLIRQWCARDASRRVSLTGSGTMDPTRPWGFQKLSPKNAQILAGLPIVYTWNTQLYRDELLLLLRGHPDRPRWRIPVDAPQWYRDSLQSEERVPRKIISRGRSTETVIWQPRTVTTPTGSVHARSDNHWWDCEAMQVALVSILDLFAQQSAPDAQSLARRIAR